MRHFIADIYIGHISTIIKLLHPTFPGNRMLHTAASGIHQKRNTATPYGESGYANENVLPSHSFFCAL